MFLWGSHLLAPNEGKPFARWLVLAKAGRTFLCSARGVIFLTRTIPLVGDSGADPLACSGAVPTNALLASCACSLRVA